MQDHRSSLPGFLRRFITRYYHPRVIAAIDEAGYWHDISLAAQPSKWRTHNRSYLRTLAANRIPLELRLAIRAGLSIYWASPQWLKRQWFKLVPPPPAADIIPLTDLV